MKYRNFDIELYEYEQQDNREDDLESLSVRVINESFSVRVTNSPAGDQSPSQAERMTLPYELRTEARHLRQRLDTLHKMIEYGEAVANCIMPPNVRQKFFESMRLIKEDEALRLRLKFDAWQLVDLPWEFIYVSRTNVKELGKEVDGFLALDRRISIVRYEYTDHPIIPLNLGEDANIRQLVLLSSPSDMPPLELEFESKSISESLQSITNLTLEFLIDPTVEVLQEALDRPTHIFHFEGHGVFKENLGVVPGTYEGRGYLILCDSEGMANLFPADKLALNLVRCGVRIAFLNADESANRNSSHRLSGVASALVYAGIPAVIGHNGHTTVRSSTRFSKAFYRALAAGNPVDTAVTNGRLAIFNQSEDDNPEWGTPVLFLRSDDSTIFPIRTQSTKALSQRPLVTNRLRIRDVLVKHFSVDELKLLCDDITDAFKRDGIQQRVDLEIVGGNSLETYALNLIQHLERRELLGYLVEAINAQRPNLLQANKG